MKDMPTELRAECGGRGAVVVDGGFGEPGAGFVERRRLSWACSCIWKDEQASRWRWRVEEQAAG